MALLDDVKEMIVDHLECAPELVEENSTFEEIGADSLDEVEIVMCAEEKFDVEIPDSDAEEFKTVSDLVKYIEDNQ